MTPLRHTSIFPKYVYGTKDTSYLFCPITLFSKLHHFVPRLYEVASDEFLQYFFYSVQLFFVKKKKNKNTVWNFPRY